MLKRLAISMFAVLLTLSAVSQEAAPPEEAAAPAPPLADIQQVQIQMWIGETGEQGLRELGANLDFRRSIKGEEFNGNVERITTTTFNALNPDFRVTLPAPDQNPYPDNLRPDLLGTLADGVQSPGGIGAEFSIVSDNTGTLDGVFRGIEQNADLDLISKPELLVINNMPAKINAGGEVPYQAIEYKNNQPQLFVKWRNIGVNMELVPLIRNDGLIDINLTKMDVSDVLRIENIRGIDLPVFSTRTQTGQFLVPNNTSLVIGGLTTRLLRRSETRVPIVGKLPLLGIPFRGRKQESNISTLFIFIRPTIVNLRELTPPAEEALTFWQRDKWRNQNAFTEEVELMENEL